MLGRKVGHYHITRLIGRGGMGQVYEAVHEEIERRAAIKLLLPQFTNDPEAAARFLNEARAVNIVQHPSLVSIFEFGRLEDGSAYIIMEYLEGETLRSRMAHGGGRLGSDAIRIARQIASALAAAHAKRIIHRDLKPANVMLVADPDMAGGERVKVLDFGIAKLADNLTQGQFETRVGTILGSPAYMSPEQCRNVGKVDDRSDVYALGILIYEMLAGRQPFRAESEAELMAMQMYASPPPLHQLVPDVDPELARLTLSMLKKAAADRPAMQDVLATLNRIGGFTSTAMRPMLGPGAIAESVAAPSTLSRASGAGTIAQQPRRNARTLLVGGGALLAVLVSGFLVTQELQRQGQRPAATAASSELPTAPIRWSLGSEPTGAQVFSAEGNRLVGQTPYAIEALAKSGVERLVLRMPGYRDSTVTFDRAASAEQLVVLLPQSAAATSPGPGPSPRPPGGPKPKGPSKSARIKNADIKLIK